jgi:hypothetical protein
MIKKYVSLILKHSTGYKELTDYKNVEFRFAEQKILNKQKELRVYFNLKFDSKFI